MQMKVTEPIQTVIQKLEGWFDLIGLIPNMAVTLLLLIILSFARLGSKLFNRLFAKHQIKSIRTIILNCNLCCNPEYWTFIMLGARLNKALSSILQELV
jgi:hypothetical protein